MRFNATMLVLSIFILGAWLYVSPPLLKRWDDPTFLNLLVKTFPLYLALQIVPLIGGNEPPGINSGFPSPHTFSIQSGSNVSRKRKAGVSLSC
jgi:hypothetical protein